MERFTWNATYIILCFVNVALNILDFEGDLEQMENSNTVLTLKCCILHD